MDAHLVRRFCEESGHLLLHARLEKIQSVQQEMFSFLFYTSAGKRQLCLRPARQGSFLFLTSHPFSSGLAPSAQVMRLRKFFQGHRVASIVANPFERRIYLLFEGVQNDQKTLPWLLLDLREGPVLLMLPVQETPVQETVLWPTRENLASAIDDWRSWPVLTPQLRRTLKLLDPPEAISLVCDLHHGGGPVWLYRTADDRIQGISAWPRPAPLRGTLREESYDDVLPVFEQAGQTFVFEPLLQKESHEEAARNAKERKRLDRLAGRLEEEETRLNAMCAAKDRALLIQSHLWRLDKDSRTQTLEFPTPEGTTTVLSLDPRLTILENMQQFFHTAERGKRGLLFLEKRKKDLDDAYRKLGDPAPGPSGPAETRSRMPHVSLPPNVESFHSSDGFLLLRGRNARGNLAARKLAKGHDIWLHTVGGPGSHVIIRLAWPGQTVPETTLEQAGTLAANRSWQKDARDAEISYAEIRHIRPMRGAAPGTVHIDKIWCTRRVPVNAALDDELRDTQNTLNGSSGNS